MNDNIFIKLYLDEDVDVLIANLIRPHGFEVITTTEVGRKKSSDAEQLEYAAREKLTILTHNRKDFEKLAHEYFDLGRTHAGMIVSVQRLPAEIANRLLKILSNVTADEMINQIYYI